MSVLPGLQILSHRLAEQFRHLAGLLGWLELTNFACGTRWVWGAKGRVSNVDGCSGAVDIANRFATNFHQSCLPNSWQLNEELKQILEAKFNSYCSESKLHWI